MATAPVEQRRLATLAETARRYGVAERTIRRRVYDGTLRAYRIGRLLRVDLDDAEASFQYTPATRVEHPNVPAPHEPRPTSTRTNSTPTTVAGIRAKLAGSRA
ncbi:helix-turn-helix domain-containing protein [Isoptericola sp. AK164]|uniref:helix-turn-helix domain-containing protein n=1 Tax=Isoptericola sp. AK164 TaxID=3024246 RepID=UPI0024182002|nr:helix-turn-helix domain-containing protein [Isoptericola sp. AK164]